MLKLISINKKYKRLQVLSNITFSINQGEVVGILGPNGVGKTTLIKIILGIIKPNDGEVYYNNINFSNLNVQERLKHNIGYLSQEICLIEDLTVEDNFFGIMDLLIKEKKIKKSDVHKMLLDQFGFNNKYKQKIFTLSYGEKRKLEIAILLLRNIEVIFFDELFTGIDPLTIYEIQKIIKNLSSRKVASVIAGHDVKQILTLSNRILCLIKGKLVFDGSPKKFLKDKYIIENYLGSPLRL